MMKHFLFRFQNKVKAGLDFLLVLAFTLKGRKSEEDIYQTHRQTERAKGTVPNGRNLRLQGIANKAEIKIHTLMPK